MTWLRKPKHPRRAEPQVCQRCGERPPDVHIQWVGGGSDDASRAGLDRDWWLCSECAQNFRRSAGP